jgi:ABC-2 type transport system permease protein
MSAAESSTALVTVRPRAYPGRDNWRQFWDLSRTLASHEMKQRYLGSVLGHVWSLLRPLLLFGVMYFVFEYIVRFGEGVDHYPIYLLMSIVLWTYFAETTARGVNSLVGHQNLMRKINFPRFVVPFSLALTSGYQLAMNTIVLLVFALASGLTPRVSWLAAVPLVVLFAVLTVGVAMMLSTVYVRFRDTQPIWEVVSQVLFWGSPIIYVATFPPEPARTVLAASPVSSTLTQMRHWFIDPTAPTAADVLGGTAMLLIPIAIAALCVIGGVLTFGRLAPRIAEEL